MKPVGRRQLNYDRIALVLQGGGALGSYQAGVYEALEGADLVPDWVAGISIGAINAALIAGNAPHERAGKLRAFWELISTKPFWPGVHDFLSNAVSRSQRFHSVLNQLSAAHALVTGQSGFFEPRFPPPFVAPPGTAAATSWYDTTPLKATLEELVDFDRLNRGEMRFSVGAVNVRTGNLVYFDNTEIRIRPEHVMASGALPPGFPGVEIDGELYWDGGVVSNTPLQQILDTRPHVDTLAFQVDLWSARGELPKTMPEVLERQKDITYSSRTRFNTDTMEYAIKLRSSISSLLAKLPAELKESPEAQFLREEATTCVMKVVHLIYRRKNYETHNKDYEFSLLTMDEHWRAGCEDTQVTLSDPVAFRRPPARLGFQTYDVARGER